MPGKKRNPSSQTPATRPSAVVAVGAAAAKTGAPTAAATRHRAKAKCRRSAAMSLINMALPSAMLAIVRCPTYAHTRVNIKRRQRAKCGRGEMTESTRRGFLAGATALPLAGAANAQVDRKSVVEGKSVSVRVDLGGRRVYKKK